MKVQVTSPRRPESFKDSNVKVVDSLTTDLRAFIEKLPDNPATTYLKAQVWSKFVSKETDPPELRRQRAIDKWLRQEEKNAETNVRLAFTPLDYHILGRVTYEKFMLRCSGIVETIIGAVPPDETLIGSFSGGASTSRKRTDSHPAKKYVGKADVSRSARELWGETYMNLHGWSANAGGILPDIGETLPGWAMQQCSVENWGLRPSVRECNTNQLFTVPKNTSIDRVAAKEPDLNMFLQKGVGNYIRSKLRRNGVNLNDQSINRGLAREGSITGALATIDLSSASDSVSWELVFQLMPTCWFPLLDAIRSKSTLIDGVEHDNEMFSSMGNGFTFELESLIFYSIARAVCYVRGISGIVSVYGDDLIVPTEVIDDLVWVLEYLGFSVNMEKSFWDGSFRESCGGHYDNGHDITPFYVRRPILKLTDLIHTANAVRAWSARDGYTVLDSTLFPLWEYLASYVPGHLWGGHELGSITQLVTPHSARKRLVPLVERRDTGRGGYIHWLNTTWVRESLGVEVETSVETLVRPKCRTRPARESSSRNVVPFPEEVMEPPL